MSAAILNLNPNQNPPAPQAGSGSAPLPTAATAAPVQSSLEAARRALDQQQLITRLKTVLDDLTTPKRPSRIFGGISSQCITAVTNMVKGTQELNIKSPPKLTVNSNQECEELTKQLNDLLFDDESRALRLNDYKTTIIECDVFLNTLAKKRKLANQNKKPVGRIISGEELDREISEERFLSEQYGDYSFKAAEASVVRANLENESKKLFNESIDLAQSWLQDHQEKENAYKDTRNKADKALSEERRKEDDLKARISTLKKRAMREIRVINAARENAFKTDVLAPIECLFFEYPNPHTQVDIDLLFSNIGSKYKAILSRLEKLKKVKSIFTEMITEKIKKYSQKSNFTLTVFLKETIPTLHTVSARIEPLIPKGLINTQSVIAQQLLGQWLIETAASHFQDDEQSLVILSEMFKEKQRPFPPTFQAPLAPVATTLNQEGSNIPLALAVPIPPAPPVPAPSAPGVPAPSAPLLANPRDRQI